MNQIKMEYDDDFFDDEQPPETIVIEHARTGEQQRYEVSEK